MLVIIHAGQTGVERGAAQAARAAAFRIAGFMPPDRRDELGLIPPHVAEHLLPHHERGRRSAVYANITLASGVLVVVPDASAPDSFTGMTPLLQHVRAAKLPLFIADPKTALTTFITWVQGVPEHEGSVKLMVTGPRETRWQGGEALARRLIAALALQ
jgi:hypothetical protein